MGAETRRIGVKSGRGTGGKQGRRGQVKEKTRWEPGQKGWEGGEKGWVVGEERVGTRR